MNVMRSRTALALAGLLFAAITPVAAQQRDTATRTPAQRVSPAQMQLTSNRDVILEIPELSVDSIGLTVKDVKAHVSLDANAMNFVQLTAGVDVGIKQVQLGITGVYAEAYLYVDLDNVAKVVGRVVQTLDRNPQILTKLLAAVDTTVNAVRQPAR
jgi:sarcosine oxidase gamma subunit